MRPDNDVSLSTISAIALLVAVPVGKSRPVVSVKERTRRPSLRRR
jgi:hypothetical protein